jgi:hypothetical protein
LTYSINFSVGLGVVNHHGNFSTANNVELKMAGIHSETSIFVELKHEEKLDEKQEFCIQAALLYTTSQGKNNFLGIFLFDLRRETYSSIQYLFTCIFHIRKYF